MCVVVWECVWSLSLFLSLPSQSLFSPSLFPPSLHPVIPLPLPLPLPLLSIPSFSPLALRASIHAHPLPPRLHPLRPPSPFSLSLLSLSPPFPPNPPSQIHEPAQFANAPGACRERPSTIAKGGEGGETDAQKGDDVGWYCGGRKNRAESHGNE